MMEAKFLGGPLDQERREVSDEESQEHDGHLYHFAQIGEDHAIMVFDGLPVDEAARLIIEETS